MAGTRLDTGMGCRSRSTVCQSRTPLTAIRAMELNRFAPRCNVRDGPCDTMKASHVRQIVDAIHKKAQAPGQKARYRFNGGDRSIQNDRKADSTLVMSHLLRPLFNGGA